MCQIRQGTRIIGFKNQITIKYNHLFFGYKIIDLIKNLGNLDFKKFKTNEFYLFILKTPK
jgi:hypothetical protein